MPSPKPKQKSKKTELSLSGLGIAIDYAELINKKNVLVQPKTERRSETNSRC